MHFQSLSLHDLSSVPQFFTGSVEKAHPSGPAKY